MNAVLDRCVARFKEHEQGEQEEFRGLLITFRNLYGFYRKYFHILTGNWSGFTPSC